jgi:uncharacterized membrane protein YkgB
VRKAGEKLMVMETEMENIVLLESYFLSYMFSKMEKEQNELRKILKENPYSIEIEEN